jgi:hypothetical protein
VLLHRQSDIIFGAGGWPADRGTLDIQKHLSIVANMDALLMMTDLWDMVLNGIVEKWYFFVAFVALVILANKVKSRK